MKIKNLNVEEINNINWSHFKDSVFRGGFEASITGMMEI